MTLISSVHVAEVDDSGRYVPMDNAFWNGEQMAYGDGDGVVFIRFTRSLDVVGHELTHGVVTHTCNLEYRNESGALNEHFADVFGSLVKQWKKKQTAAKADWLIGPDIMGPGTSARALRTFKEGPAYANDPLLGTDPQPKHLKNKYTGSADSGGVHINSGIPNHAFYLVATSLGGYAWDKAGRIWYRTMLALNSRSDFKQMVAMSTQNAAALFGHGSTEEKAVVKAWQAVGF
jgi:Zn-dependent metalloprotease